MNISRRWIQKFCLVLGGAFLAWSAHQITGIVLGDSIQENRDRYLGLENFGHSTRLVTRESFNGVVEESTDFDDDGDFDILEIRAREDSGFAAFNYKLDLTNSKFDASIGSNKYQAIAILHQSTSTSDFNMWSEVRLVGSSGISTCYRDYDFNGDIDVMLESPGGALAMAYILVGDKFIPVEVEPYFESDAWRTRASLNGRMTQMWLRGERWQIVTMVEEEESR